MAMTHSFSPGGWNPLISIHSASPNFNDHFYPIINTLEKIKPLAHWRGVSKQSQRDIFEFNPDGIFPKRVCAALREISTK
jgi:hypothetical protein